MKNISRSFLHNEKLFTICAGVGLIFAVGCVEAFLLSKGGVYNRSKFIIKYGGCQIANSILKKTTSGSIVARSLGLSPNKLLRTFDPNKMSHAETLMRINGVETLRCVLAGLIGLS